NNYLDPITAKYGKDAVEIDYFPQSNHREAILKMERIATTAEGNGEYPRIVLIGYSWGGYAAAIAASMLHTEDVGNFRWKTGGGHVLRKGDVHKPVQVDLIFTVDPVQKQGLNPNGRPISPNQTDVHAGRWINYYQHFDTHSVFFGVQGGKV